MKDKFGINSFWIAAYYGHVDIIRFFCKNTMIDLHTTNENGSNALHIACKRGFIEVVRELIRHQYPLNTPKSNGVTALGIAAHEGHFQILKALSEAGADLNITTNQGISALSLAIKGSRNDCIQYLLENGC